MRIITILSVGAALSLSGCGRSDEPPPTANGSTVALGNEVNSSGEEAAVDESDQAREGSETETGTDADYSGTPVEGTSVEAAADPSQAGDSPAPPSDADASADDQPADGATDASSDQ